MKTLEVVRTANRNLLRSKLRTILTISAIFVGAFTLTLTTALGAGAQQYLTRQLGNISAPGVFYVAPKFDDSFGLSNEVKEYDPNKKQGTNRGDSTLTQADVAKLGKVEGVKSAKPYYTVAADYMTRGDGAKKYQTPTVTQYGGLSLDLSAGRLLNDDDKNGLILPENFVTPLGFSSAQDAVSKQVAVAYKDLTGNRHTLDLTVVGVLKKSFVTSGEMYVDDMAISQMAKDQGQNERFTAAFVTFAGAEGKDEAVFKKRLTDAGSYTAISLKDQISTITTIISAITTGLNVIGIIALFAASFGIINTLLMSVYERTQEIGLMKALGMHRRAVFGLFAFEAILVGFWGALVATLAGWGAAQLVNNWASTTFLKDFEGFNLLVVTPGNGAMVIGLIMLVAFIAGTLPAIKASRLNPIDALRSE